MRFTDEDLELCGAFLLITLSFLALTVLMLRRVRYSLGELLVLYLVTGLGVGLAAQLLPATLLAYREWHLDFMRVLLPGLSQSDIPDAGWPFGEATVMALALLAGSCVFFFGANALYAVHWLEVREPRRRLLWLLRSLSGAFVYGLAILGIF